MTEAAAEPAKANDDLKTVDGSMASTWRKTTGFFIYLLFAVSMIDLLLMFLPVYGKTGTISQNGITIGEVAEQIVGTWLVSALLLLWWYGFAGKNFGLDYSQQQVKYTNASGQGTQGGQRVKTLTSVGIAFSVGVIIHAIVMMIKSEVNAQRCSLQNQDNRMLSTLVNRGFKDKLIYAVCAPTTKFYNDSPINIFMFFTTTGMILTVGIIYIFIVFRTLSAGNLDAMKRGAKRATYQYAG